MNPLAQYGGELTVDEVLAAREIVWPFTLQMCSPISDGAAAALLVSDEAGLSGNGRSPFSRRREVRSCRRERERDRLAAGAAYEAAGSARPTWTAPRFMTRPPRRSW